MYFWYNGWTVKGWLGKQAKKYGASILIMKLTEGSDKWNGS